MSDTSELLIATEAFVRDLVLPGVAAWDREDALPEKATAALDALNLTGALVAREHGGPGYTVAGLVPVW
nr:acyl-CoA dehydrogenase family protein [Solirubrobacterales bacterium]